ncbi:MAG: T9SS type A sorting domain-containing protein [Ignavibacteria bacterium]|nr:T9SS type A sorting domain-containing protein [Ignavibacteria bacterium]
MDKYTVTSSETPSLCNTVFDKSVCYSTEWGGSGFYKTVDYGESWTLTGTTGSSGWGSDMCHEDPTVVLKEHTDRLHILQQIQERILHPLHLAAVAERESWFLKRGYLLAMQCSGLFKMKIDYTVITDININLNNASVPEDFNLYQNFPNPFNPSTSIKFDIPNSGNVSLKIYDQRGIEVNSLIEGFKNAGSYEVSFNASELPSGVYFYKLSTKKNTIAKKDASCKVRNDLNKFFVIFVIKDRSNPVFYFQERS